MYCICYHLTRIVCVNLTLLIRLNTGLQEHVDVAVLSIYRQQDLTRYGRKQAVLQRKEGVLTKKIEKKKIFLPSSPDKF